jgi:putative flippase GtrA
MGLLFKENVNKEKILAFIKQFIKFGIVGLSNTFISLAIY